MTSDWTTPLLPFLRVQVGIADEAVQTKFGSFLNSETLDPQQLTYMNQIISYARENGDIVFLDLQKVSPFCDVDIVSLFGTKITHIKTLINGFCVEEYDGIFDEENYVPGEALYVRRMDFHLVNYGIAEDTPAASYTGTFTTPRISVKA